MKKKKSILVFVAVIIVAMGSYVAGYMRAPDRARRRSEARFRIGLGIKLHNLLESGDTNGAIEDIRFVLWSDTESYARLFGVPSATDGFSHQFAEAKAITAPVLPRLLQRATNARSVEQITKDVVGTNTVKKIEWK